VSRGFSQRRQRPWNRAGRFSTNAVRPSASEAGLTDHAGARLAKFKVPSRVVVLEEFLMTQAGKVQKFRLRELLLATDPTVADSGA
jgi:acyl-CoA synthetase (AMP-forming)/AMP-acid ligase II